MRHRVESNICKHAQTYNCLVSVNDTYCEILSTIYVTDSFYGADWLSLKTSKSTPNAPRHDVCTALPYFHLSDVKLVISLQSRA